jgi:hypothetical protein
MELESPASVDRCREGDRTNLGLKLCSGELCFEVDSTCEDQLLDLRLRRDHRVDEGCAPSFTMSSHVTLGCHEVGLGRGERHPPVLYFLVGVLFAMKQLKMINDLRGRAQSITHQNDIPHMRSDVGRVVVALQECCQINLLISLAP